MARVIPVRIGVVNPYVCRLGRRRVVGIGVSAVCTHHDEIHGSRQGKEKVHAWLVDARGIRGAARLDRSQHMRALRVLHGLMMLQAGQDKARQRLLVSGERQVASIPRQAIGPK
jgi:hypothetical protein